MKHAIITALLTGTLAAGVGAPALASQAGSPHPDRSGEEMPTIHGGWLAADPPGVAPADWLLLKDHTGTIIIMVPPEWIAGADNAPRQNDDGTPQPRIAATTDPALFNSDDIEDWFGVPGVIYRALPLETDTAAHLRTTVYHDYCTPQPIQAYNDGVFTGHIQEFNDCAGTATRVVEVVANPADAAFTAVVEIQLTGQPDDQATLDSLLRSFDRTGDNPAPTTGPPATPNAVSNPQVDEIEVQPGAGYDPTQWTELTDDTGTISISVPVTWTAIDVAPGQNDDGTPHPWISATTDASLFFPPEGTADTFGVPGVVYSAYPVDTDTAAILEESELHEVCTADPVQTFDDGVYVGHIQTFNACGGTTSRIVGVAANAPHGAYTSVLLIQLTGEPDDAATLDGLLASFDQAIDDTVPTDATPTSATTDDPLIGAVQQSLHEQFGWSVPDETARCLLDDPDFDPTDRVDVGSGLLRCSFDLLDLPSG
jgi:hypothetical protein